MNIFIFNAFQLFINSENIFNATKIKKYHQRNANELAQLDILMPGGLFLQWLHGFVNLRATVQHPVLHVSLTPSSTQFRSRGEVAFAIHSF